MPALRRTALLLLCLSAAAPADAAHPAEAEIRRIVDRFQYALAAKDGATLYALFLAQDNAWLSVASERQLAAWRARGVAAQRVKPGNHAEFIARVIAQPERIEETFSDIKIHTDGTIASVHFDFVFLEDGREVNRGEEAWHLVRTDAGWKISSVIYSVNRPG
ncbi:nuclear transport factor 2 family protein [Tahibacter harae]|uniref:Nuclear transport factor 2 family protein n=1 Tax=Tahibacter harae TaxID=2963937 RepID=A0ABT1QMU1_9GAMM|nr:nuclear transport factor 2 family protein [Tahibacter harae]MCQ4163838.1 nuclear transport factor 2 family protein [Tahibacter harae]